MEKTKLISFSRPRQVEKNCPKTTFNVEILMDEELSQQISGSKVDVSDIAEALENFDIDKYLHEKIRNLDERLRALEIKFHALCNSRR